MQGSGETWASRLAVPHPSELLGAQKPGDRTHWTSASLQTLSGPWPPGASCSWGLHTHSLCSHSSRLRTRAVSSLLGLPSPEPPPCLCLSPQPSFSRALDWELLEKLGGQEQSPLPAILCGSRSTLWAEAPVPTPRPSQQAPALPLHVYSVPIVLNILLIRFAKSP